ncbi:MAG TPA: hypothetical protein VEZ55_04065 [Chitinophagaceae bacterium]|jgi:hypothetical protein|nr:hypothetical protein [Chitinophagaceae bacterium]
MKRFLYIVSFFLLSVTASVAQDDDGQGTTIRERMTEYIQNRLHLSKAEAERFGPTFINYFNELRKVNQEYKGDKLLLQKKIVETRLNFRNQFKDIVGEKRSNDVFVYERDFVDEVKRIRQERMQNDNGHRNKKGGLLQ